MPFRLTLRIIYARLKASAKQKELFVPQYDEGE